MRPLWFPRNVLSEDMPFDHEVPEIEHLGFDKRKPSVFKIEWLCKAMVELGSKTYLRYPAAADREEHENLAQRTLLDEALEHEDHEFDDVFDLHDPDEEIVKPPPLPRVPQPLHSSRRTWLC